MGGLCRRARLLVPPASVVAPAAAADTAVSAPMHTHTHTHTHTHRACAETFALFLVLLSTPRRRHKQFSLVFYHF